ncbi:hypothetical protein B296_00041576 [Ensete ventricosum]|uniref:WRKY domain-containing protein n=1 Tax=Ensete ventricosum TaxID=4639 RepID=A0A426XUW9_ENSVE|nr:hypothetical protein B296_00041576 [Ensete ventricosum]
MAMASATSAAASTLFSGSTSSADGLMNSNFLARAVLPCSSSVATISASAPFPTVTLDLTRSPDPLQSQRTPAGQFQFPFAALGPLPQPPSLPPVFGQTLLNQSRFSGLQMSPGMATAQFPHPKPQTTTPSSLEETVNAATAAITADPNFTAVLAAAIKSIICGNDQAVNSSNNADDLRRPALPRVRRRRRRRRKVNDCVHAREKAGRRRIKRRGGGIADKEETKSKSKRLTPKG